MKRVQELLDELHRRGARIVQVGDRLRITAPVGAVPADLLARVSAQKPQLMRLLSCSQVEARPEAYQPLNFGDVCPGWTPAGWATELRRKADRCQCYRRDIAEHYLAWATDIETRLAMNSTKARKE